jgi:hypothetical protein
MGLQGEIGKCNLLKLAVTLHCVKPIPGSVHMINQVADTKIRRCCHKRAVQNSKHCV